MRDPTDNECKWCAETSGLEPTSPEDIEVDAASRTVKVGKRPRHRVAVRAKKRAPSTQLMLPGVDVRVKMSRYVEPRTLK